MPRTKTIEQLRKELEKKEKLVGKLRARRAKIVARVESIDRAIAAMTGAAVTAVRAVQAPAVKGKRKAKGGKRPPRGESLPAYITLVLQKAAKPMRAMDVQKAVLEAGYKTNSKDFYGIVATALRDKARFRNVKRGVYTLK
jgi:hypothetical protein